MISREEIQNLAELSRLKLADEEVADLQKDFDSILEYVGQIEKVGRSDLPKQAGEFEEHKGPTLKSPELRSVLDVPELRNVMREDELRDEDDPMAGKTDAILAQAPKREGNHFVVRKIIDREQ